jgi:tetratricopeptide (TPR) repeat protein
MKMNAFHVLLWLLLIQCGLAQPQVSGPKKVDPISAKPKPEEAPLELPELPGSAGSVGEDPLSSYEQVADELPAAEALASADLLPPLAPFRPGYVPEPEEPPLTPDQLRLRGLGTKIVSSVVGLRVWDAYGTLLASGIGTYISRDGVVLTDPGLVHPEIADKIDSITVLGAAGQNERIIGFYVADLKRGLALFQSERKNSEPMEMRPGVDFRQEQSCHVVAMSEKRGLVLADATVQMDDTLLGLGWLNVRGQDSPGGVGSPIVDDDGRVIGLISMQVPLKSWMNFGLSIDAAVLATRKQLSEMQPLSALPKKPKLREVAADPAFTQAFELLQERRFQPAVTGFTRLVSDYPRNAECWALLGLAANAVGAKPEALNCQRKAVALDPDTGLYWHQLAMTKLRAGAATSAGADLKEDREALEQATEQRPNDALSWLLLASRQLQDGDLGSAQDSLKRLQLLAPNDAQAHYLQAYLHGKQKNYSAAQISISRALKLSPAAADAWYYQGLLLEREKNLEQAVKAYRNATKLRPQHRHAGKNLAYALRKLGREQEAKEAFQKHIKSVR